VAEYNYGKENADLQEMNLVKVVHIDKNLAMIISKLRFL